MAKPGFAKALVTLTAAALQGMLQNESKGGSPEGFGNDAAKAATQALKKLQQLNPEAFEP